MVLKEIVDATPMSCLPHLKTKGRGFSKLFFLTGSHTCEVMELARGSQGKRLSLGIPLEGNSIGALLGNCFPHFYNFCQLMCRHLPNGLFWWAHPLQARSAQGSSSALRDATAEGLRRGLSLRERLGVCADQVPTGKDMGRVKQLQQPVL